MSDYEISLWPVEAPAPQHSVFLEETQFRAKFQRFGKAPPELTVQRITFDRDVDRYRRAAENGNSSCFPGRRTRNPDRLQDTESVERSQRRAKTKVRLLVTELAPNSFITFTTRKLYPLDHLARIWETFCSRARLCDPAFQYVAVPEPHPSNPDHYHLHVAARSTIARATLRRLWHIALEAFEGRRVTATLRGSEAPGNIDEQPIKGRDTLKRIRKIARYISKYITKDLIERFNRKRYWPSKGINLAGAQVFWLTATDQGAAIREACVMFGAWDGIAPSFKAFLPSERVFWMPFDVQHDPPF
jgi:hypothetical protein